MTRAEFVKYNWHFGMKVRYKNLNVSVTGISFERGKIEIKNEFNQYEIVDIKEIEIIKLTQQKIDL